MRGQRPRLWGDMRGQGPRLWGDMRGQGPTEKRHQVYKRVKTWATDKGFEGSRVPSKMRRTLHNNNYHPQTLYWNCVETKHHYMGWSDMLMALLCVPSKAVDKYDK